jgi:hypothetical protein
MVVDVACCDDSRFTSKSSLHDFCIHISPILIGFVSFFTAFLKTDIA